MDENTKTKIPDGWNHWNTISKNEAAREKVKDHILMQVKFDGGDVSNAVLCWRGGGPREGDVTVRIITKYTRDGKRPDGTVYNKGDAATGEVCLCRETLETMTR